MYWANAIIYNQNTKQAHSLFTYEGVFSIDEAKETISTWKSDESIQVLCAYIKDETTDQIVYLENNVNAMGEVTYESKIEEENTPKL